MKTNYDILFDALPDEFTEEQLSEIRDNTAPKYRPQSETWKEDAIALWVTVGLLEKSDNQYRKADPKFPGEWLYKKLPVDFITMKWAELYQREKWGFNEEQLEALFEIWRRREHVQWARRNNSKGYHKTTPKSGSGLHSSQNYRKGESMPRWEKGTSTDPDLHKSQQ